MAQAEPVAVALLVCDNAIAEEHTKKKTLIGIFSVIWAAKFPLLFRPFWVYISVTNVRGEHSFALNILHEETRAALGGAQGNLSCNDADAILELVLPIGPLTFTEPGRCVIEFNLDGNVIMSRHLLVKAKEE